MKRFIPLLVLAALLATWPALGLAEGPRLYKDFNFGISRDQVTSRLSVRECSNEVKADALCASNHKFLGYSWDIGFLFISNKLVKVFLNSQFETERHLNLIRTLGERFQLVMMTSGSEQLDLLMLAGLELPTEIFINRIDQFEVSGLQAGDITYYFFQKEDMKGVNDATDFADLKSKASLELREVAVFVKMIGFQIYCTVWFSAPKAEEALKASIPAKKEDF